MLGLKLFKNSVTEEEVAYISAIGMMKTNKEVAYDSLEKLAKLYK